MEQTYEQWRTEYVEKMRQQLEAAAQRNGAVVRECNVYFYEEAWIHNDWVTRAVNEEDVHPTLTKQEYDAAIDGLMYLNSQDDAWNYVYDLEDIIEALKRWYPEYNTNLGQAEHKEDNKMNNFEEQYTNAIEDWLTAIESHDIPRFIDAAKRLQQYDADYRNYDAEHHNDVLTYLEEGLRPCISENDFDYIIDSLIWIRWNHLYSFASDISFIQRCRTRFDEDAFDAEFERLGRLYPEHYCIERRERWNALKNESNWNVIVANPGFFGEGRICELRIDKYGNITSHIYPDPDFDKNKKNDENDENDQNK